MRCDGRRRYFRIFIRQRAARTLLSRWVDRSIKKTAAARAQVRFAAIAARCDVNNFLLVSFVG